MGKIICDICGTSYPDTAQQCPICGCTREAAAQMLGEDFLQDEAENANLDRIAGTSSRKRKEIFDYDEVNADEDDYDDDDDNSFAEGDEYEETEKNDRPNTFAVIILTVLIAALLLAAGVLFFRYILPNMNQKKSGKRRIYTANSGPDHAEYSCGICYSLRNAGAFQWEQSSFDRRGRQVPAARQCPSQ